MEKKPKQLMAPLLGVAIYLMVTMPSKDVDMPTDDASPEVVVAAYIAALDAGDCETAKALVVPSSHESTQWWCSQVASMSNATVAAPVREPAELSGSANLQSSGESEASREVVNVRVTFDFKRRPFAWDISLPDGPTNWGYGLQRVSPGEPWRIFSGGHG